MEKKVIVIGGGLAGSEAAWHCLNRGASVSLYEMRPNKSTEAHKTGRLAELVCSNSFKSLIESSASGQLKSEMEALDSLIIKGAKHARVPAGNALAVDRDKLSSFVEQSLDKFPRFKRIDLEITAISDLKSEMDAGNPVIVATGPLTSGPLAKDLMRYCDSNNLYFYDAIAPILDAESLNRSKMFVANRYEEVGEGDYLNIPLSKEEYYSFVDDVIKGEKVASHNFEEAKYFESCLPIEVMAERGVDTLRFGPMKPVGFIDPNDGRRPYAVIQLRLENDHGSMYSMVGFQTKLKWPEQKRIFSKLPGMENVEFFRYGSVHRNTYFQSPDVLNRDLAFKNLSSVFLAGQLTGVEGYTESAAMGLLAGKSVMDRLANLDFLPPPRESVMGALYDFVVAGVKGDYQPMNANLGLLPDLEITKKVGKADRKRMKCERAATAFSSYIKDSSASFGEYH